MTENEFHGFIEKYNFFRYADIVSNEEHAVFTNMDNEFTGIGCVYIWVEKMASVINVVYVGKAGKTIKKRCGEHSQGFKKRKVGVAHSDRIINNIKKGKSYAVYVRESKRTTVFGEDNISLCSVEETAFIRKLSPPWNTIKT